MAPVPSISTPAYHQNASGVTPVERQPKSTSLSMDALPPNGNLPVSATRPIAWRRACVSCTRAKRQCTKQVPRCRRCLEKGLQCAYPPPRRPEMSAAAGVEGVSPHLDEHLINTSADVADRFDMSGDPAFAFLQMPEPECESFALPTEGGPSGGSSQNTVPSDGLVSLRGAWFLAPASWTPEFTEPPPTTIRETEKSLKQFIEQVQSWMRQWVTESHSPLHHRELYSFHMPRHTQDAHTAMAMYMGKTRENESTVHQILEDRVSQLLQDQAVETSLGNASGDGLSIFDRLSRVQSLLCYQLIRLYDGDIRMRSQAEDLIPTLFLWNKQMLEGAKDSLGHPERFLASSPFHPNSLPNAPDITASSASAQKAVWWAWVVAESIRRTWQATNVVQEVYQFFKRGWSECPGRLPSTMRRTLWDAQSAYSWMEELKAGKDPLLVSMAKLEETLSQIIPAEIDDFNLASIGLYGMEKTDQWLEKAHSVPMLMPGLESMMYTNSMG